MAWKAHLEGQNFIFFSTFGGWVGGSDPNVENSTFIFFIFFEYFPNPTLHVPILLNRTVKHGLNADFLQLLGCNNRL